MGTQQAEEQSQSADKLHLTHCFSFPIPWQKDIESKLTIIRSEDHSTEYPQWTGRKFVAWAMIKTKSPITICLFRVSFHISIRRFEANWTIEIRARFRMASSRYIYIYRSLILFVVISTYTKHIQALKSCLHVNRVAQYGSRGGRNIWRGQFLCLAHFGYWTGRLERRCVAIVALHRLGIVLVYQKYHIANDNWNRFIRLYIDLQITRRLTRSKPNAE